ncbi:MULTISPECIES: SDR family oxidoreductase [Nocardioides]|uniref:SDR family oxidoreductase n=1 Tax=Nocardioides vastitatis TaxID=2568655 RepID=A0ABW0ZI40_9ACTN|nr:SDR family oxidoreductase [Nocardioides sp.]THI96637.1 SDR family oxidoreductase [Nocardioides sp.]
MTRPSVFITGAAAGIGRAIASRFAREGYLVGAYDVDLAGLATLASDLGPVLGTGRGEVVTGELDVSDPAAWRTRLDEFSGHAGGRLDVLVNNAGVLRSGPFADIPLEAQHALVDVNVKGVLNGCHTAYPLLSATPGAHVVNLASASAIYGQPELATYSATKFAVRGITEALDLEWAREDITVRAVWPLFVKTAMTSDMDIAASRSLGVRLTPQDVADEVYAVVRPHRLPRAVHRAVGRQATALMAASAMTPGWLLRAINRRIAGA